MAAWLGGAALGAVVAALLLRRLPVHLVDLPGRAVALGLVAALVVLGATVALLAQETVRFARLGLVDAGATRNRPPPLSEEVVAAAAAALGEGERWALETSVGRCEDDDYAYYWLAFRLYPAAPDCADPDVRVLVDVPVPRGATVLATGDGFAVVR